jgi:hypothetical protein
MAARRPQTPAETAARRDLRQLPKPYRDSAIGKAYLALAEMLDAGPPARDAAALAREMRLCYMALEAMAPRKADDDFVDEVRQRREARMAQAGSQ